MDKGGCVLGGLWKRVLFGGIVAFKLPIRCFKGVLGDQGCESTTFWTKLGCQAKMNAFLGRYDIFLS